jgi:hypothetical protein
MRQAQARLRLGVARKLSLDLEIALDRPPGVRRGSLLVLGVAGVVHIFLVLLVGSLLESLKLALLAVIERRCIALADHADCASRCRA